MNMAERFPDDGHDDERAVRELMRALDAEAGSLDPRIAAHLARARRGALERRRSPALGGFGRPRLALAGTAAAAALAAILVAAPPSDDGPVPPSAADPAAFEGLPVLSGTEDLEFYESIDFLLWLENRRA